MYTTKNLCFSFQFTTLEQFLVYRPYEVLICLTPESNYSNKPACPNGSQNGNKFDNYFGKIK